MKKLFLFCTKLRMFISEIPVVFLLVIAIKYNGEVKSPLGLIPLIVLLSCIAVFIVVFLFRFILISKKEIRIIGLFSSKDSCKFEENKITVKKGHYVYLEVWGKDAAPEFEWINKNDPLEREVRLFREKYVGGAGSVKRILRFFQVPSDDLQSFLGTPTYEKKYGEVSVLSQIDEGNRQICVKFLSTL